MDTIVLKYDARNPVAQETLDYILSLGVFEKHNITNIPFNNLVHEGYMTSEEFRKQAVIKVNTFCDKHGIL